MTGTIQGSGAPLGLGANNTWTGTNQFQGAVSFTGSVSIPDGGLTFTGPGATATRAALSLVPGTDLQPFDADLTQLAGLTKTKGNLLGANGTLWTTHPAGTNGQVLTVDSAQPLGFRWADPVTDLDDPVLTGSVDLSGADQIRIIEAAAPVTDATGEMALDNNAWGTARGTLQIHDGTAPTFVVNVLASDTPLDGQVPRWNTGGTITWEDPAGAPADASYLTQTPAGGLSGEQALSALSSGIMRVETATGVVTSLTTSAGISSNLSDETGTGALVFGTSPTIGSPSLTGDVSLSGASSVVLLNGPTPVTDATAELAFDTNAWGTSRGTLQVHDGTASTYLVNVLASDTPVEGGIRSVPSRWRIRSCTPFRWGNNRGGEKKPTVRNSTRPP